MRVKYVYLSFTYRKIHTSLLACSNMVLFLGQPYVLVLLEHTKVWQSDKLVGWDCWRGNFCWMCWAARPQALPQQRAYPTCILMAQNFTLQERIFGWVSQSAHILAAIK